jgi:hypothetical protein
MDDERSPGDGLAATARALEDRDLVLVHSESETGVRVIRSRRGSLEVGEIRALREGQPISGEVVRLAPTEEERVFEVDVMLEAQPRRQKSGPAQVASAAYRAQWDAIFGDGSVN